MPKSIEPNWPLSGRRPPPFRVSGDADLVVGLITSPDRKLATTATVLAAMRGGQSLHLQYQAGNAPWSLSGGQSVSADLAIILTSNTSVAPVDDALFSNMPGQTWRYVR